MKFNERLKMLRLESGLTQLDLAKMLGVGRTTISEYENGKIVPKQDGLIRLADILGVSVDYLTCNTNVKTVIVKTNDLMVTDLYELAIRMCELLEENYPKRHISVNNKVINDSYHKKLIELQIKHLIRNLELISSEM